MLPAWRGYAQSYPASSPQPHHRPTHSGLHPAAARTTRETPRRSSARRSQRRETRSSVHLPEHDVERPQDGRHVREQMAAAEEVHGLEMGETRRADLALVGLVGAVGDEVDAELALGRLDGRVDLTCGDVEALGVELEMMDERFHRALH